MYDLRQYKIINAIDLVRTALAPTHKSKNTSTYEHVNLDVTFKSILWTNKILQDAR